MASSKQKGVKMKEALALKIGGSSLPNPKAYEELAKKIIPLKDKYDGPIAITISAMEGETDRLKKIAEESYTDAWRQVQHIAENGEFVSAALMEEALKNAGANVSRVTPWDIKLKAEGEDPENCRLLGADEDLFEQKVTNSQADFVIIPGYVAVHNEQNESLVALGRNSTDLIAVEVAHLLSAPLYFVKSAPSVYAVDPRLVDNPKPISRMTHEQALKFLEYLPQDDQFIMRRAVKHAQDKEVELIFGSLNGEKETRITVSSNGKGISQFAALPVKQNAAIIRFTISSGNKHRARLQEKLQDEGINFADINEIEDFAIGRVHYELYTDSEKKDALAKAVRPFANDRRVNIRDVALITLIDTDLDPNGHHTNLVANAFAETDIQYTKRTSGTILHIPVSPKDTREAVKLLAEKFALIQNTD